MGGRREKRFNIRARLFVGSLPNEVDEEWLRDLFKPHSEVNESPGRLLHPYGLVDGGYKQTPLVTGRQLSVPVDRGCVGGGRTVSWR